jgi:hypothetical protein
MPAALLSLRAAQPNDVLIPHGLNFGIAVAISEGKGERCIPELRKAWIKTSVFPVRLAPAAELSVHRLAFLQ